MSHLRSEPSVLAESRVSSGRGSSATTGRKWPLKDRSGVRDSGGLLDGLGKRVMLIAKSEPAEASSGSGEDPGKISNALTTDLCSFVVTVGCMICVVGIGYVAVTGGEGG
jgi:hypothetical protein